MKLSTLLTLAVIAAASPSIFAVGVLPPNVPDSGASALLLGIGSFGLLAARQIFRKK
jgi:hypothetical protein